MQNLSCKPYIRVLFLFLFTLSSLWELQSQTNFTIGQAEMVTIGEPKDFVIPNLGGSLTVTLRGGDGGGIRFSGLICETTVEGGGGATINATFEVGYGPGQLHPGGTIRAYAGEKGESDSKACGSGAASYAGGGGSSAILYLPPNADPLGMNWQLLAVAGAGGGASRPSSGIDRVGGGATASDPSGGVNGISGASGGNVGNRGSGNQFIVEGRPGAGYNGEEGSFCINSSLSTCFASGKSVVETAQTVGNLITVKLLSNNHYNFTGGTESSIGGKTLDGGNGFTGGGHGSTNALNGPTAGGGGGGFSGGSVNYYFGGGGGSSYVTGAINKTSSNISAGTGGASGHNNGFVSMTINGIPIVTQANCQNQTVQLNANGQGSLNASQLNNGSTGFLPLTFTVNGQSTLNFTCADVGDISLTLNMTDANGQSSSCSAIITIADNVGPTASCQNATVQLNASGNGMINVCQVDAGSSDACGSFVGLALSQTTFTCDDIGNNTVTMTATDFNGNTSSCNATITVQDNVAPSASCKDVTVQLGANGTATLSPADIDNGSSDNCGTPSLSISYAAPITCDYIGSTTATLTATDNQGNTSSCDATVTIQDNTPPIAVCQPATVQLDGSGSGILSPQQVDGGSSDNCGIGNLSLNQVSFDCSGVGSGNMVTLTVSDGNGNFSTCMAAVTVADNVLPTAACKDITVQLNLNGQATVDANAFDDGSMDNCSINRLYYSDFNTTRSFDCTDVGMNTISNLIIEDNNGNFSSCNATLTIEDATDPFAVCDNVFIQLDATGQATVTPQEVGGGSEDACGIGSLSLSQTSFGCAELGTNIETLTVTDVNGNTSTCTATIAVEDYIIPTAICQDITIQLDESGNASITAADVDGGSFDNCIEPILTVSQSNFDCSHIGANTVTLTAAENNGRNTVCTATVTVEDNIAPAAFCLNNTVELQVNGTYTLAESDVLDAANSTDNCPYGLVPGSMPSVSFPSTTFTCDDTGLTFPITVTIEDQSGNTQSCVAMITVETGTATPAGWTANDIGDPGSGSDYAYNPCAGNNPDQGDFTISTGGYNLFPNDSDNLAFLGRELCNDGGIQARIEDVTGGYAGLMIRESSAPGAKMMAVYSNLTNLLRREIRTVDNGARSSSTSFAPSPFWLRLVRQDHYIRAFYRSTDNGSWTLFHQVYLPMQACVEMGLAVFTTDPNGQAEATFGKLAWQSNVGGSNLAAPNGTTVADALNQRGISVFPNPTRDAFTLLFSEALQHNATATLRNQTGQAVRQLQLQPGQRDTDWDVSGLPGGLYLIEVQQEGLPPQVLRVIKTE